MVTWSPAVDNSGTIQYYTIIDSSYLLQPFTARPNDTTANIINLTNGTAYSFIVTETNTKGSRMSDASVPVIPDVIPNPPTIVSVTSGNQSAVVTWTPPVDNSGTIQSYTIVDSSYSLKPFTAGPNDTTANITNLTNGTAYSFIVTANNTKGSTDSSPSDAVIPDIVPNAPTIVSVTSGNKSAVVTWTAPVDNSGTIQNYTIVDSSYSLKPFTAGPNDTTATISGLINGTAYSFIVSATNTKGSTASSPSDAVIPATISDPPTDIAGVLGDKNITVSWNPPVNNGGFPITSYTVTSSPGNFKVTTDGSTTAVVSGLTIGTAYTFTVTATNVIGKSNPSSPSAAVTYVTVSDPPTNIRAIPTGTNIGILWNAPINNGGSPITGYTVTSVPDGLTATSTGSTTATITGLRNRILYRFTVIATNSVGNSVDSEYSNSTQMITAPDPPTNVIAVGSNRSAVVTWTAPEYTGGLTITKYKVTSNLGNKVFAIGATTATFSGLTNGTPYTFTVTATTKDPYTSIDSSPSNTVIPDTNPDPPTGVTAVAGDQTATVSWIAPLNNGGESIIAYTVTSPDLPISKTTTNGSTTTAVIAGLTNGTSYKFNVTATNQGNKTSNPSSDSNTVIPDIPPNPPTNVTTVAGNKTATVYWREPVSNGGTAIQSYTISDSSGLISFTTGTTDTSANIPNLTNGTSYAFKVLATNIGNSSVYSSLSNPVTLATVPDPPKNLAISDIDIFGNAIFSWSPPDNDGGSPITSYNVTASPGGFTSTTDSSITSVTIPDLDNTVMYTFSVSATNIVGTSDSSNIRNTVIVDNIVSVPTNVTAVAHNASATIRWDPPLILSSQVITNYTVTSNDGIFTASTSGSTTTAVITGLTNGTTYTFTVTATVSGVISGPSADSNPVTPQDDNPQILPTSNICFLAGTPITTNQGNIPIEQIDPSIHTIRGKQIVAISKTVTEDKYLVCFEKDSLGPNLPSKKTIISKNHVIFYKGTAMKAIHFVGLFNKVYKIQYTGEVLYNVLMETHDKMLVNNLICETLHPDLLVAKLYKALQELPPSYRDAMLKKVKQYVTHKPPTQAIKKK
jgi:hypothetical protein